MGLFDFFRSREERLLSEAEHIEQDYLTIRSGLEASLADARARKDAQAIKRLNGLLAACKDEYAKRKERNLRDRRDFAVELRSARKSR